MCKFSSLLKHFFFHFIRMVWFHSTTAVFGSKLTTKAIIYVAFRHNSAHQMNRQYQKNVVQQSILHVLLGYNKSKIGLSLFIRTDIQDSGLIILDCMFLGTCGHLTVFSSRGLLTLLVKSGDGYVRGTDVIWGFQRMNKSGIYEGNKLKAAHSQQTLASLCSVMRQTPG